MNFLRTINSTETKPIPVTRYFIDTNVLVYAAERTSEKAKRANALILGNAVVSVQVLNEFVRVLTRKTGRSVADATLALAPIKMALAIVPLTVETHERALQIADNNQIANFDANIIAAAELAGCDILYTENMNNGQRIGSLAIVNPFL